MLMCTLTKVTMLNYLSVTKSKISSNTLYLPHVRLVISHKLWSVGDRAYRQRVT